MPQTPTKSKRGSYHKNGYAKVNNQEIYGLKCRPDGRFYSSEVPSKTFGRDPRVALMRFTQWQADRKGVTVKLVEKVKRHIAGAGWYQNYIPSHDEVVDLLHKIPAKVFWTEVRERLLADPFAAARATGLPLDRLESLPKPKRQEKLRLTEIGDLYGQKTFKDKREREFSDWTWSQFSRIVGKANIDKITEDDLFRFHSWVMGNHPPGEWTTNDRRKMKRRETTYSPRFVKNIYRKVASILNHAVAMRKDFGQELESLKYDIRKICIIPKQRRNNPKPIDVVDFHKLLNAAGPKMKCILVLSLNTALHSGEAADLLKSEFTAASLRNREFVSNRTKTGESRVARLWVRTCKLVADYQNSHEYRNNRSDYLFTNAIGGRMISRNIADAFSRLRRNAGLDKSVSFDGIRDLFRKAAGTENIIAIKWAMGHSLGIDDVYGFRSAEETEATMAKVERFVFDGYDSEE